MSLSKNDAKPILSCLFFLVFWIVPILYTGLTQRKIAFFPRTIRYFQSVGNLFTHRVDVWPMPYIQVLLAGEENWKTLLEKDYFPMETFGYRTRLFEALYYATNILDYDRKTQATRAEIARWIAKRYAQLNPGALPVQFVRFVAGLHFMDPREPPAGHWQPPPYESFPEEKTYILSSHDVR